MSNYQTFLIRGLIRNETNDELTTSIRSEKGQPCKREISKIKQCSIHKCLLNLNLTSTLQKSLIFRRPDLILRRRENSKLQSFLFPGKRSHRNGDVCTALPGVGH